MVTPEQIIYQQPAEKLIVETLEGRITVLPHHTPLVAVLKPGEVRITEITKEKGSKERLMAVSEGVIEIRNNEVRLLVQTAERVEELNQEKILKAKKAAEEMMEKIKKSGEVDERKFADLEATLQREIAKLKLFERYRKKK